MTKMSKVKSLEIVACDAGSVVSKGFVERAVAEGRATVWKTKEHMGTLLGRDEIDDRPRHNLISHAAVPQLDPGLMSDCPADPRAWMVSNC